MAPPKPPTSAELAASLGMTVEQVREMGQRYRRWVLWGEWGWTE